MDSVSNMRPSMSKTTAEICGIGSRSLFAIYEERRVLRRPCTAGRRFERLAVGGLERADGMTFAAMLPTAMRRLLFAGLLSLLPATLSAQAAAWQIDPGHSSA